MRSKAKWAIDSDATRVRGIIICFSKIHLVRQKNIETKLLLQVKARQINGTQLPLFWFSKLALFATGGLYTFSKIQLVVYH